MLNIDLVHSLYHHTRAKERAIGIDFDSELVTALYGALVDLAANDVAKMRLATELKMRLDQMKNRMRQIMSMVNAVKDKRPLLDEAIAIQGQMALAVQMLEVLANG